MIFVRERCHAPGRQQDGTTDGVTEACAPKNSLHKDKMLLLLPALCINNSNGNHVHNVADTAAKLKNVYGFFHAQKHRANGFGCFHRLQKFVCNVSGIEVWKDKCVDTTIDEFTEGITIVQHLHVKCKVYLHFAIYYHTRKFVVHYFYSLSDAYCRGVV